MSCFALYPALCPGCFGPSLCLCHWCSWSRGGLDGWNCENWWGKRTSVYSLQLLKEHQTTFNQVSWRSRTQLSSKTVLTWHRPSVWWQLTWFAVQSMCWHRWHRGHGCGNWAHGWRGRGWRGSRRRWRGCSSWSFGFWSFCSFRSTS